MFLLPCGRWLRPSYRSIRLIIARKQEHGECVRAVEGDGQVVRSIARPAVAWEVRDATACPGVPEMPPPVLSLAAEVRREAVERAVEAERRLERAEAVRDSLERELQGRRAMEVDEPLFGDDTDPDDDADTHLMHIRGSSVVHWPCKDS